MGRGFFSCPRRQSAKELATSAGVAKKAPSQISYFC
ncbi:helix-turn-helix domain-containing protein [Collinsella aerofaciens]